MERRRISALFTVGVLVGLVLCTGIAGAGVGPSEPKLKARLSGANEVPAADPDGEGGARFELKVEQGQVCFKLRFHHTGTPNRGHIHIGDAGANGPIVVPLFELQTDPTNQQNDALESRHLEGCVPADEGLLNDIAADPGAFYCNLHNSRFPGGAIRGQLVD